MRFSGTNVFGRLATRLATIPVPPYKGRLHLARMHFHGYVAPSVEICHDRLEIGRQVFVGDRVAVYKGVQGGGVTFRDKAAVHRDCVFETGFGGSIVIGESTSIQNRCQFSAYAGDIRIGNHVQIAPACSFFPYDHGLSRASSISGQPLTSEGPIVVEDDAWIGAGAVILENVHIGTGAVVGAGAVVTKDVADYGIAVGNPAAIIGHRN
jgi:acetyltransferase-like isoleucine patch superfamily enzyme